MTTYVIQKLRHPSIDPSAEDRYTWIEAYGLNKKSWPECVSDDDAIEQFTVCAARARTPRRLIKFIGGGYGCRIVVLSTAHIPSPKTGN
jgi:hypothetical protein